MNKRFSAMRFGFLGAILVFGVIVIGRAILPLEVDSAVVDAKRIKAFLEAENVFPGGVGVWSSVAPLPGSLRSHVVVSQNNYIYVIGGTNSSGVDTKKVWFATSNSSGTLSVWTETTSLPKAIAWHSGVVNNGKIYVMGGNFSGSPITDVLFATINPDGTLGVWTPTTALPAVLYRHSSIVNNGYVYVFAGNSTGGCCTSTVRYAPINASGTIGTWTNTTPLVYGHEIPVVFYNGYVYAVGGSNGLSPMQNVRYASVDENGSIGAWTNTTALPQAVAAQVAVAHNGYLYSIAGEVSIGGETEDTYFAPINPNGSIGAWTTSPNQLLRPLRDHAGLVSNGFMYIFGGKTGPYAFPDVFSASIL